MMDRRAQNEMRLQLERLESQEQEVEAALDEAYPTWRAEGLECWDAIRTISRQRDEAIEKVRELLAVLEPFWRVLDYRHLAGIVQAVEAFLMNRNKS